MTILAVFSMMNGIAQEYLTGFNGALPDANMPKSREETVAVLPFFDDFTNMDMRPDASKWQSGNTSAGSGFPYMPVNYMAATLDILDRYGKVYSRGNSNPFIGDTLMSVKIRLDSIGNHRLTPADSVYFSFYFQPGGFGDSPERDDSLVLQFGYGYDELVFDTVLNNYVTLRKTEWRHVWATEGFECDSVFHKVMIPITDTCYFKEDFRILFFNYGTLPTTMYPNDRSNMDQWNVDMVYLDMNRHADHDSYPLVSFTNNPPTFLNRYQSMPYKHYKANPINEIDNVYDVYLTNLDVNAHNVRYSCFVDDNNSPWQYHFVDNPMIINQYYNMGVAINTVWMNDFIYPYNLSVDTTSFTIRQYIEVIDEHVGEVRGDSVISRQEFGNYFAYDDGTPEKGYGLVPSDTYMAVQFKVTQLDTIQGVSMLFNRTFNNANYNFFDIVVWKDNNGKPGEEIYTLKNQRPVWDDTVMYAFHTYDFDRIVKVNSVFYVGLRQQYSKSINIGFDASTDNRQYNFYETGDGWRNSSFPGSIMIRPVMGTNPDLVISPDNQNDSSIEVYPNPARDIITIENANENLYKEIVIFDVTGRLVKRYSYNNTLNVNELQNGVYVLRAVKDDGSYISSKLMICK